MSGIGSPPFHAGVRRRLRLVPLAVILAAAALWLWFERRADRSQLEIEQFVTALCEDAAAGREDLVDRTINRSSSEFVGASCASAIQDSLVDRSQPGIVVAVEVETGDHESHGDGSASHLAVIHVDGEPRVGLRIVHRGASGDFMIIGFWREDVGDTSRESP